MSIPQLDEVKSHLSQAHLEVACTLVYSDHSTQLRNKKVCNKEILYNGHTNLIPFVSLCLSVVSLYT